MARFQTKPWTDYQLLDCGDGRKLEKFGSQVLIRPEHKAIWKPKYSAADWSKRADSEFVSQGSKKGYWKSNHKGLKHWDIHWDTGQHRLKLHLELTAFKHVGIFPEQALNWRLLADTMPQMGKNPKVLNLFAYTGAASLVAKSLDADVYHIDSVKQVISWAKKNMQLSDLDGIRWVVEDAFKFAQRELKRGNKYQIIIMDPPAFGLGAKGERWKIEDSISALMETALELLDPKKHLLIVNTYTPSITPGTLSSIYRSISTNNKERINVKCAELTVESASGLILPYGATLHKIKV